MSRLRVLLVDDEPLALDRLTAMFSQLPEVEVVGTARDGLEAVDSIKALVPDLVMLDIQMPERSGLLVAADLPPDDRPEIVFVTGVRAVRSRRFRGRRGGLPPQAGALRSAAAGGGARQAPAHAPQEPRPRARERQGRIRGRDLGAGEGRIGASGCRVDRLDRGGGRLRHAAHGDLAATSTRPP
jgi:CheY-like chemotaxis protein